MHTEIFRFIQKFCATYKLSPEIEFTCYELYPVYFQQYFNELNSNYRQTIITKNFNQHDANALCDQFMIKIKENCIVNAVMLISICGKYIDGFRGHAIFKAIPIFLNGFRQQYLHPNHSYKRLHTIEFNIFRCLKFNVSKCVCVCV